MSSASHRRRERQTQPDLVRADGHRGGSLSGRGSTWLTTLRELEGRAMGL
jgi:hypothetical protein